MFKNYFKIALRTIIRNKAYAAINISGLTIGIATCLLLFIVVKYELSYDTFQPGYSRIYHVASKRVNTEGTAYGEGVPFPAYDALKAAYPQVKTCAIYMNYNSQVTVLNENGSGYSNKKFLEETGVFFSDTQLFSVFHYKWLAGSPSVLAAPDVTVLTKRMAEKYFGKWQNAMGRLLRLDNTVNVKVAGILEDIPLNTDFPLAVITSYETMKNYPAIYGYNTDYGNITSSFQAFMLLPLNVDENVINKQLISFSNEHYNKDVKDNDRTFNFLQPLNDIHFNNSIGTFGSHITTKTTLWTLSLIGVFIIIMACINFINLSTAQAVGRSKEVGIRKVLGSNRWQLFRQMIGEIWMIVMIALLLAFAVAFVCLPYIKNITSIEETLSLFNTSTIIFILIISISVTLLAGTYPALILSGFKPALALKNKITSAKVGGISLRRGLVITQFAISQVLIIGTIVAVSQMNYIRTADLGYNKDAVLFIENGNSDSSFVSRQPAFKQQLLAINGVQSVSFSSDIPSSENNNSGNFAYDHRPDEKFDMFRKFADEDYFKTYGLKIIAGRVYSKSDTVNEVVLNETMVKKLGIKNSADIINHQVRVGRNTWCNIAGVVKDFKTNSMREAIKPLALMERNKNYSFTGIKLRSSNLKQSQATIEKTWNRFYPEYVFTPGFLDNAINDFYTQENQLSLLYKIFAGIAIFISCLGLYGLVSFMAAQRTKEVGIRKVLGASVANIIYLFSKEFTILIIVAFAVAVPVAYYMMHNWLNNFAFRINITVWVFTLAIILSVIIAWITVGYKSIRAAMANPVKSLRAE